jgi:4-hydroxybenzoate polyprenyltransferase
MRLAIAFLRLIRWPNLVFIALTQIIYYYSILEPISRSGGVSLFDTRHLVLLILASLFISAAGYIINDYFDLNIDRVNKPGKLVIEKVIKRRSAMALHLLLSFIGVALSFYVDYKNHFYWLGLSNLLCVFLLFGYSITLKKKLLAGNILIAALTSWVLLVIFFCYYSKGFYRQFGEDAVIEQAINRFIRITFLYAGFSFVISLIREVIKDMEDMEGDAKYGCKTMPIVWGVKATKVFVAVWIIVLICALAIVQFYVLQFNWWLSAVYCLVLIIAPLVWILRKLYEAQLPAAYHQLSSMVKFVMFTGILSMFFFKIYS